MAEKLDIAIKRCKARSPICITNLERVGKVGAYAADKFSETEQSAPCAAAPSTLFDGQEAPSGHEPPRHRH